MINTYRGYREKRNTGNGKKQNNRQNNKGHCEIYHVSGQHWSSSLAGERLGLVFGSLLFRKRSAVVG
jgi:hypothetical protein